MPPLPKRKLSKGRRDRRRSHLALASPNLAVCPNCHKMYVPHRVCPHCGHYAGEQIFVVKEKKARKK
ncbi:MAG: 50S ribosomal protein L32 [Anaerolineae bacterium]|nr:50S ribosomal protein L32 [Anaerolineae bacterium]